MYRRSSVQKTQRGYPYAVGYRVRGAVAHSQHIASVHYLRADVILPEFKHKVFFYPRHLTVNLIHEENGGGVESLCVHAVVIRRYAAGVRVINVKKVKLEAVDAVIERKTLQNGQYMFSYFGISDIEDPAPSPSLLKAILSLKRAYSFDSKPTNGTANHTIILRPKE